MHFVGRCDIRLHPFFCSSKKPGAYVTSVQKRQGRHRPRLHWCPTGLFMSVPVHAAGTKLESCSNYFVSSYTPTLSALIEARHEARYILRDDMRVLLAATKSASGLPTLWSVHEELAVIKSIVPSSAVLDVTHDDRENVDVGKDDVPIADATKDKLTDKERQEAMRKRDVRTRDRHHYGPDSIVDDILAHLPRADIVHLACHRSVHCAV
jgi:hypothetical protein